MELCENQAGRKRYASSSLPVVIGRKLADVARAVSLQRNPPQQGSKRHAHISQSGRNVIQSRILLAITK